MTSDEEFRKNAMEKFNLPRCSNNLFVYISTGIDLVLDALKQVRVLADFAQLHELITEAFNACRLSLSPKRISNLTSVGSESEERTPLSPFHQQSSWISSSACTAATATRSCVP